MKRLLACLALVLACAWAYAPVVDNGFVSYDDPLYLTDNPVVERGLSAEGLRWAFNRDTPNFHPLTWLSHMLDVELFGLEPAPHHLMSVGLHALAACVLFLAFVRLGLGAGAAFAVALVFAVHPLRVQSVAWASERKDVLSGLFFALTLLAWSGYTRSATPLRYALVALCMLLGLLAKSMLVTLPCVLLLVDVWPLRRTAALGWRRPVLEKLPLLALAAAFSWMALLTQSTAGTMSPGERLPLGARAANACSSVWTYAWKSVWPTDLAVQYPHRALVDPDAAAWNAAALGGLAALLVTTGALWLLRRSRPGLLIGWLWFLGMLTPVIGLVQVGGQAWADRYAYLPTVGLYLVVVSVLLPLVRTRGTRTAAAVLVAGLALVLGVRTRAEVPLWRDSETLYRHALAVTEKNATVHFLLGTELLKQGRFTEAHAELERAATIDPADSKAQFNLGAVSQALGDPERALGHFRRTVELAPENVDAHVNIGLTLGLGGAYQEAFDSFERALAIAPENPRIHTNLGLVARRSGDAELARQALGEALRLDPDSASAHYQLGRLHEARNERTEALTYYEGALDIDPEHADADRRFAWLVATGPASESRRNRAVELARGEADLDLLAATLAAVGRFEEAVRFQERALEVAPQAGTPERRARLERYRNGLSLVSGEDGQ